MSIADEIRNTIQAGVYANLKMRRGMFG